jgi:hypothetical protein
MEEDAARREDDTMMNKRQWRRNWRGGLRWREQ